jgi:hypothetical protein
VKNEDRLKAIESQLFHIKLLLLFIADLCILGFYGLTRMNWDDIDTIMTQIWEVFLVLGLIATIAFPLIWSIGLKSRTGGTATGTDSKHTAHSSNI